MPIQARDTGKTPLMFQPWIPHREAHCRLGETIYSFQMTVSKKRLSCILQTRFIGKLLTCVNEARKGGKESWNGPWVGFSACLLENVMIWKHLALMLLYAEDKYLPCRVLAGGAEGLATCCQINELTQVEERLHCSFIIDEQI